MSKLCSKLVFGVWMWIYRSNHIKLSCGLFMIILHQLQNYNISLVTQEECLSVNVHDRMLTQCDSAINFFQEKGKEKINKYNIKIIMSFLSTNSYTYQLEFIQFREVSPIRCITHAMKKRRKIYIQFVLWIIDHVITDINL